MVKHPPGKVRDAVDEFLWELHLQDPEATASPRQIGAAIEIKLGMTVARSSVQTHLKLHLGRTVEKAGRAAYRWLAEPARELQASRRSRRR